LRSFFKRSRGTAKESEFLLLLDEKFEGVFENRSDGAATESCGDILSVEEQAIDFPFLGTTTSVSKGGKG